jgi:hypothetical protein
MSLQQSTNYGLSQSDNESYRFQSKGPVVSVVCRKKRLFGKPRISDGNIQALVHHTDSTSTVAVVAIFTFCCWVRAVMLSLWCLRLEGPFRILVRGQVLPAKLEKEKGGVLLCVACTGHLSRVRFLPLECKRAKRRSIVANECARNRDWEMQALRASFRLLIGVRRVRLYLSPSDPPLTIFERPASLFALHAFPSPSRRLTPPTAPPRAPSDSPISAPTPKHQHHARESHKARNSFPSTQSTFRQRV